MNDVTWVGIVAVMLLAMNLINLYNSLHTATKNAHEPMDKVERKISEIEGDMKVLQNNMGRLKEDVDRAHEKIRKNEQRTDMVAKAQNRALLAILLWIKDPQHEDQHKIDDAIKAITEL